MRRQEQLEPWFLALNPQHTVPTLVDGGRSLWDSHAICTYLIGKYGGEDNALYPRDLYTRARIDQRLHFDTAQLFTGAREIIYAIIFAGAVGPTAEQTKRMNDAYAFLETFLATDAYMVGAQLTVADLALITSVTQVSTQVPLDAEKYPKILAWIARVSELPYYHDINTVMLADFVKMLDGVVQMNKAANKL